MITRYDPIVHWTNGFGAPACGGDRARRPEVSSSPRDVTCKRCQRNANYKRRLAELEERALDPATQHVGGFRGATLRRELVLCGKSGCSRLHGPYWYAYVPTGPGKLRKLYFGRTCPDRYAVERKIRELRFPAKVRSSKSRRRAG